MEKAGLNIPIYREKQNTNSILYIIEWVNSEDILNLRKYLYEDATVYLERKFKLFESFRIIPRNGHCPECLDCDNGYLRVAGYRTNSKGSFIRYRCAVCGKNSQVLAQIKED